MRTRIGGLFGRVSAGIETELTQTPDHHVCIACISRVAFPRMFQMLKHVALLPWQLLPEREEYGRQPTLRELAIDFSDTELLKQLPPTILRQATQLRLECPKCGSVKWPRFLEVCIDSATKGGGMNIHQVVLSAQARLSG